MALLASCLTASHCLAMATALALAAFSTLRIYLICGRLSACIWQGYASTCMPSSYRKSGSNSHGRRNNSQSRSRSQAVPRKDISQPVWQKVTKHLSLVSRRYHGRTSSMLARGSSREQASSKTRLPCQVPGAR
ncbi:uncharacterized protein LOC117582723 [Drosophila guanche]|uniref:uncharacterized protein LOC117582723 n=1 Tax=Drosophila guanche TaxID=7266 RepID=UPI001471EE80|nr:uncharacterized protein LOC117582723 [Drosophila guanche]